MNKKKKITLLVLSAVVVALVATVIIYANDYYRADSGAVEAIADDDGITLVEDNGLIRVLPSNPDKALIFYPGGKVDEYSYIPLAAAIARQCNAEVIIVAMPLKLAILGANKADDVISTLHYDEIFIGGHSLGGAMASRFYAEHTDSLSGLILLGAYPMGECDNVLSIYGSNDLVLSRDKAIDSYVIEGGNHAYYGNYGLQSGDGDATISREEQQRLTVLKILEFMEE